VKHSPGQYLVALVLMFQVSYVLKRAIFLLGEPSQIVYYTVEILPLPFLLAALTSTKSAQGRRLVSTYALALLLLLGSIWTIVSATGNLESYGGIFLVGVPFCGYFLGLQLRGNLPRSLVITYLGVIFISVAYGVIQFIYGFTPLERAWAAATAGYSLQGRKVLAIISGTSIDLRPFSYYPDTMTWNTFLVGAIALVAVGRIRRLIGPGLFILAWVCCLAGLFVSLSRNAWLITAVMVATYYLMSRIKSLSSPLVLCMIAILTFFGAVTASQIILNVVGNSGDFITSGDAVVDRYSTVGTLHDRAISYDLLANAAMRYPLVGPGFNVKVTGSRSIVETEWLASHNLVVDTVLYWGALGASFYVVFILFWLRDSSASLSLTRHSDRRVLRWIIAYAIGAIAGAQFTGLPSLPFEFYLLLGFASGLYPGFRERKHAIAVPNTLLRPKVTKCQLPT
jgi:hypothetical protein